MCCSARGGLSSPCEQCQGPWTGAHDHWDLVLGFLKFLMVLSLCSLGACPRPGSELRQTGGGQPRVSGGTWHPAVARRVCVMKRLEWPLPHPRLVLLQGHLPSQTHLVSVPTVPSPGLGLRVSLPPPPSLSPPSLPGTEASLPLVCLLAACPPECRSLRAAHFLLFSPLTKTPGMVCGTQPVPSRCLPDEDASRAGGALGGHPRAHPLPSPHVQSDTAAGQPCHSATCFCMDDFQIFPCYENSVLPITHCAASYGSASGSVVSMECTQLQPHCGAWGTVSFRHPGARSWNQGAGRAVLSKAVGKNPSLFFAASGGRWQSSLCLARRCAPPGSHGVLSLCLCPKSTLRRTALLY